MLIVFAVSCPLSFYRTTYEIYSFEAIADIIYYSGTLLGHNTDIMGIGILEIGNVEIIIYRVRLLSSKFDIIVCCPLENLKLLVDEMFIRLSNEIFFQYIDLK